MCCCFFTRPPSGRRHVWQWAAGEKKQTNQKTCHLLPPQAEVGAGRVVRRALADAPALLLDRPRRGRGGRFEDDEDDEDGEDGEDDDDLDEPLSNIDDDGGDATRGRRASSAAAAWPTFVRPSAVCVGVAVVLLPGFFLWKKSLAPFMANATYSTGSAVRSWLTPYFEREVKGRVRIISGTSLSMPTCHRSRSGSRASTRPRLRRRVVGVCCSSPLRPA